MKFLRLTSLSCAITCLCVSPCVHAQYVSEHTNAAALALTYSGIEYGAGGDLELARLNLGRALNHMPYFARALLFLQICDDVRAGRLSTAAAVNIFKAINHPAPPAGGSPVELVQSVLQKVPGYGPAWIVLSQIESSRHHAKQAATALARAREVASQFYLTSYFSGLLLTKTNDRNAAVQAFSMTLKLEPSYAPAYLQRGQLFAAMGQTDLAVQDFDLALRAWPKWRKRFKVFAAYLNNGTQKNKNGQFATALSLLNKAIQFNNRFGEAYLQRGIAHLNLKSYEQALSDFQDAIGKGTATAELFYNRGVCYESKRDYDAALSDYERAVALDSVLTEAHFRLGMLYSRAKRYTDAVQMFDAVIALDPRHHWAYYWRAVSHDRNKNYVQAARAYESFLQVTSLASDSRYVIFARHRVKRLLRYTLKQS